MAPGWVPRCNRAVAVAGGGFHRRRAHRGRTSRRVLHDGEPDSARARKSSEGGAGNLYAITVVNFSCENGISGGGTMTTWLCAVEPRFTMAAPSVARADIAAREKPERLIRRSRRVSCGRARSFSAGSHGQNSAECQPD